MFHSQKGLFFERLDGGSVRIRKTYDERDIRPDNVIADVTLSDSEWASVVATLSYGGENATSYAAALKFHNFAEPRVT